MLLSKERARGCSSGLLLLGYSFSNDLALQSLPNLPWRLSTHDQGIHRMWAHIPVAISQMVSTVNSRRSLTFSYSREAQVFTKCQITYNSYQTSGSALICVILLSFNLKYFSIVNMTNVSPTLLEQLLTFGVPWKRCTLQRWIASEKKTLSRTLSKKDSNKRGIPQQLQLPLSIITPEGLLVSIVYVRY